MSFSYFRTLSPLMIKKNIPNLFTLGNLFCGCVAIVFAFGGNLVWSAYMVGICCVFDFLDGLVARALNVHSEIGKQLDSLADMVSFGVVPGVIMFELIKFTFLFNGQEEKLGLSGREFLVHNYFEEIFPYIGFVVTIFSAIRLAKFNLDERQTNSFIGLPTPANAIFISSLPLLIMGPFAIINAEGFITHNLIYLMNLYSLIGITVISSFLLVSSLPLFALKFKNFLWADNKVRYVFLLLSLALLIIFKFAGIPLIIILYIILSIINNIITKKSS